MRRCSTPPRPRSVSARRRSLSGSGASRGFGVYHCFWGWTALARGWLGACFRRTAGAPRLSIWPSLVRASSHALASADEGLRSRYPGEVWPDVFNCSNQNRGVNLATRRCNIALGHYRCDRSRNPWRRMSGELYHGLCDGDTAARGALSLAADEAAGVVAYLGASATRH